MSENPEVHVITDAPETTEETPVQEKKFNIKKIAMITAASTAALVGVLWVKSRFDDEVAEELDGQADETTNLDS